MGKYNVTIGEYRTSIRTYKVLRLCYVYNHFDTVYVTEIKCSGMAVVKYVAPLKVGLDEVAVVFDDKDVYYYHPKYRRWYKNLSNESLKKYFYWLISE